MENIIANIEIEIYVKDGKNFVYLSNDGSSGAKYEYIDTIDLCNTINAYVEDLMKIICPL